MWKTWRARGIYEPRFSGAALYEYTVLNAASITVNFSSLWRHSRPTPCPGAAWARVVGACLLATNNKLPNFNLSVRGAISYQIIIIMKLYSVCALLTA